jgi:hypothetical protein
LAADPEQAAAAAPARTGKERLSDKASDEQRTNDCKVPPINEPVRANELSLRSACRLGFGRFPLARYAADMDIPAIVYGPAPAGMRRTDNHVRTVYYMARPG